MSYEVLLCQRENFILVQKNILKPSNGSTPVGAEELLTALLMNNDVSGGSVLDQTCIYYCSCWKVNIVGVFSA